MLAEIRYYVDFGGGDNTDELDEWDAYDLDEVPYVKDFVENFTPDSPFSNGWSLIVEFVDPTNNVPS